MAEACHGRTVELTVELTELLRHARSRQPRCNINNVSPPVTGPDVHGCPTWERGVENVLPCCRGRCRSGGEMGAAVHTQIRPTQNIDIGIVRPRSDCVVGDNVTDLLSNVAKASLSTELSSQQKMQDDLRFPLGQFLLNIFRQLLLKMQKMHTLPGLSVI